MVYQQQELIVHYMAGATWNCCRLGARSVYSVQPCTSLQCDFMQIKPHMSGACVFSCPLHFWRNGRELFYVLTRGWNGYRIKGQHRKLTLEKKILRPLLRDSNPQPFNHESSALTTELCPRPIQWFVCRYAWFPLMGISPNWSHGPYGNVLI